MGRVKIHSRFIFRGNSFKIHSKKWLRRSLLTKNYEEERDGCGLKTFFIYVFYRVANFGLYETEKENIQKNNLKFVPYNTRAKKAAEITIPLIAKGKKLITDEKAKTGFLFDTFTEQNLNEQLKIISVKSEIDKTITNHTTRHTLVSLFLDKTSDVATLQRLLGHSNIKETTIYIHISTKKISEQMGEFGRLIGV